LTVSFLLILFDAGTAWGKINNTVHPEKELYSGTISCTYTPSIVFENGVADFPDSESQSLPVMVRLAGNTKSSFNFQIFSNALRQPFTNRKRPIYLMVRCFRN
jgi:hypothetical protein